MKKIAKLIVLIIGILIAPNVYPLSSVNYQIPKESVTSGGSKTATSTFQLYPAYIGDVFGGTTTSGAYNLSGGILGAKVLEPGAKMIEVRGTIDDNAAFVSVNGHSATVANGVFLAQNILINDGANTITVTATDLAGNSRTKTITVYYDSLPPARPVLNPITSPTSNSVVTLSGTKEAGTSIYLLDQEVVPANNNTTWSYNYTLSEGPNTIWVSSKDASNNESTKVFATVILDAVAPVVTVTWPYDNLSTSASLLTVSGYLDDTATVKVNGTNVPLNILNFATAVPINFGTNTITVEATSVTGKITTQTFNVLRVAMPSIGTITPADKSKFYETDPVVIAVNASGNNLTYQFSIAGVIQQAWSAQNTFTWNIPQGTFGRKKVRVQTRENGANEDSQEVEYFIYLKPVSQP